MADRTRTDDVTRTRSASPSRGSTPAAPTRAEPSAAARRTETSAQPSATSASPTRDQVMVNLGKGDEMDKRLQPFMSNFGGHSGHNHAPGESCEAGPFINPGSGWPRVAAPAAAPAPAPAPGGVQVRDGRVGNWSAQSVERALAAEGGSLAAPPSPLAQKLAAGGPPPIDVRQDMALTPANEGNWKRDIAAYSSNHYGPHDPEQNPADRWKLKPDSIVLHYTAGANFPENLTDSLKYDGHEKQVADMRADQEKKNAVLAAEGKPTVDVDKYLKQNHPGQFGGEAPGVSTHYVVGRNRKEGEDATRVQQLLPDDVRGRGALGFNHRSLSIEMTAADGKDLTSREETLRQSASLTWDLMQKHNIPIDRVVSHNNVGLSMHGAQKDPSMTLGEDYRNNPQYVEGAVDMVAKGPYQKPDPGRENALVIKQMLLLWAGGYPPQ